jgi:hypothetical protein
MPSIITAAQLRTVLGVSSALYNDAYLDDIIDTSEAVILPLLTTFAAPIEKVSLTDNVATFQTVGIHEFTEGQSVVIAGCGSPFNGTRTVNADVDAYTFTADITNADVIERYVIPSGSATLTGASTYVGVAAVESAIIVVSVEVFQSRTAPGGQIEGLRFCAVAIQDGAQLI